MNQLIRKVQAKRRSENLSQRDLARLIGVAWSTIVRLERGGGEPGQRVKRQLKAWLLGEPQPVDFQLLEERIAALESEVFYGGT